MASNLSDDLRSGALIYHRLPRPGKLEVVATKPLGNQRDLALAYSPGVAAACEAIVADPAQAAELTARANLVAVITNGSAVLGLGTLGILYRDQIFDNAAMPAPTEFNYLIIGLSLVSVAANVITVFSQTEEERLRANYRQEIQMLRESTEE